MTSVSRVHYDVKPKNVIYGLHLGDRRYRYIGLTTQGLKRRTAQHRATACREVVRTPLYDWMRKHGPENIVADVIEVCNDGSKIMGREIFWIAYYRKLTPDLLNIQNGGYPLITPEGRRRISDKSKTQKWALGYKHKPEALDRISKASVGNAYAKGYKHTEDARSRISQAHVGVPRPYAAKSAHTRWHTNKNVSKPETCKYCKEET